MTLQVYTARISYSGPDRLDVTRKGEDPIGIVFAPSWEIVNRAKQGTIMWADYIDAFTAEMRESFRLNRSVWKSLLARDQVTLVCYCADPARCHRTLLAGMLGALGATYRGERGTEMLPGVK